MSVYRDSRGFDDSRSVASARTTGGTKITRYVVKEDDYDRKSRYDDGRRSVAGTRYDDRRTEVDVRASRDDFDDRRSYTRQEQPQQYSRDTITIRRDESPERRDRYWDRPAGEPVQDRELVIRRTVERDTGERALSRVEDRKDTVVVPRIDDRRESRFSDYEIVSPQRDQFDERDREVQRYIRTTDYYQPPPPQQPQTIIIRQEPIIIRETVRDRPREEDYQIVKKSDIDDERSVSRRAKSEPRDEEFFYEKRVRERLPDDDHEERKMRRPVSPHDSISQVGRRNRGYESDDSMVYVRREKVTEYDSDGSDHHKRDLAAGALAGVGAAELIRKHNRKEGKETSSGGGRIAKDVGAGVVGAVAVEAVRRYRSKSRRRSSRSSSRGRDRRYNDRSRSRSNSNSRLKGLGGLGLAAAAVAAGALIANRNKKEASPDGRSRSRTRRSSRSRSRADSRASAIASLTNDPTATDDRNPGTRNKRTAAAGAVGAAAMALYERHRSKSRGRGRSESPNRLKQGAPIVAGGLAAAGLAHLYEKRRAKEEATDIVNQDDRRSRSRHRSRSRPRTESTYYDGPSRNAYSDPNLIQYGTEPLHGNNYGEGYYGRPGVEQDYYNNSTRDVVPVPAPPPATASYNASRGRTDRSVSSSRSRSRSRGAAAAAAAVGAGVAASELQHRRREKKDRKRRSRQRSRENSGVYTPTDDHNRQYSYAPYTAGRDPYEDANWHATHSGSYAQGTSDPYTSQTGFPPPPGAAPQQSGYQPPQNQSTYAPQGFPPPPSGAPQSYQQQYNDPYAPGQNPYAPRNRGADENVSAAPFSAPTDQHHSTSDGVNNAQDLAISPPVVGPNGTVQQPSTGTSSVQESSNKFPGNTLNPFQPLVVATGTSNRPSSASPGASPGQAQRTRSVSRAAQSYTPKLGGQERQERGRSTSAEPIHQPQAQHPTTLPNTHDLEYNTKNVMSASKSQDRSVDAANTIATDAPAPLQDQNPREVPEDPRVTAFRQAGYNTPTPQPQTAYDRATVPQDQPQSTYNRARSPGTQTRAPEMKQTNRYKTPFMPSPDIRPPSDESLTASQQQRPYASQPDTAPSMPNLYIPEHSNRVAGTYTPPTEEPQRRGRERSSSVPQIGGLSDGDTTPRAISRDPPGLARKKSVKFNPNPEFSDAPGPGRVEDADAGNPEVARRKRQDRERERERERGGDRDRDGHPYDAGDDFSDDTPFEDHRRRSHDRGDGSNKSDRGSRPSSRRERSNTQSLDRESGRDAGRHHDRDVKRSNTLAESSGSSSRRRKDRDVSPSGSDDTIDLPERFDNRGRRKTGGYGDAKRNPEEDMIAESLDQILGGLFGGKKKKR